MTVCIMTGDSLTVEGIFGCRCSYGRGHIYVAIGYGRCCTCGRETKRLKFRGRMPLAYCNDPFTEIHTSVFA